jgi:hypothetical protein
MSESTVIFATMFAKMFAVINTWWGISPASTQVAATHGVIELVVLPAACIAHGVVFQATSFAVKLEIALVVQLVSVKLAVVLLACTATVAIVSGTVSITFTWRCSIPTTINSGRINLKQVSLV